MRLRVSLSAAICLLIGGLAIGPPAVEEAEAKASLESQYSMAQTYHAALRLLRVDLGLKILERDPEAGYLLFEYRSPESGSRAVSGSMELVDAGRVVTVLVQIPAMPHYHEQVLTDRLARKLREEYGDPPRKSERSNPDAGAATPPTTPAD